MPTVQYAAIGQVGKERVLNLLKPTGYGMHQQVEILTTVRSAHSVFMCFVFV
jgi:hypothetical protein